MMPTRTAVVAAALVLVGAASSAAIAQADPNVPAPPEPKATIDADGTYAVGKDIQPGRYSSAGPVGDGACYWKRANGTDIIDNALSKKAQVVQIEPTDTTFTTNECQSWQLTDAPLPAQGIPGDLLGQLGQIILHPAPPPPPPSTP
jgi:hypothetical protein